MSATEALKVASDAGIKLRLDGADLVIEASARPPAPVLDLLSRHKPRIVALLRAGLDCWKADDWRVFFDERAGIAEFDGGLPRAEAETRSFSCCVAEWLNRNPASSLPGRCLGCGGRDHTDDPLRPYGREHSGHAWLHSRCWMAWSVTREAEAVAALAAMGIHKPRTRDEEKQVCQED